MGIDWDDAFANAAYIPGGDAYLTALPGLAADFRARANAELNIAYGEKPRQTLDIFWPGQGAPKGLMIFFHGGYWMYLAPRDWSHMAAGALDQGYAVCLPGYTLTPEATLPEIAEDAARAVSKAADLFEGPLFLSGHSAGGQIAAKLVSSESKLDPKVLDRIARVTCISGVYDLRPLLMTRMNWTLGLNGASAASESPMLLRPRTSVRTTLWVGSEERPIFLRQSRALHLLWGDLGGHMSLVEEQGAHHFSVLDGFSSSKSPLLQVVLGD
ncbi:MAG: alpha/beta hydrolase [Pseudomonadota bacterium]